MPGYSLIASESTSQVVSPTIVLPVEYFTIQSQPSGVIASMPISSDDFRAGTAAELLTNYAANIEQLMTLPHVIAGQGSQTLDANGLLQDNVVFTVQYKPPNSPVSGVTAEAVVPSSLLGATWGGDNVTGVKSATQIIDDAYANLVLAAGG